MYPRLFFLTELALRDLYLETARNPARVEAYLPYLFRSDGHTGRSRCFAVPSPSFLGFAGRTPVWP